MASLERLQEKALGALTRAERELATISPDIPGQTFAVATLQDVRQRLALINMDVYRKARKAGSSTVQIFDAPVVEAIQRIAGGSILDLPHDLGNILQSQNVPQPDGAVLQAVTNAKAELREAHWALRLLRSARLRFLMGPWPLVAIFGAALVWAAFYFFVEGVQHAVPAPASDTLSVAGKAQAGVTDLRTSVEAAGSTVDALKVFVVKLTELISALPPLIAAAGVLYALVRKSLLK